MIFEAPDHHSQRTPSAHYGPTLCLPADCTCSTRSASTLVETADALPAVVLIARVLLTTAAAVSLKWPVQRAQQQEGGVFSDRQRAVRIGPGVLEGAASVAVLLLGRAVHRMEMAKRVPGAPTWPFEEPTWPRYACFGWSAKRRSGRIRAALPAITHENPLGLAKLLKRKDQELAERVGFAPSHVVANTGLSGFPLPPDPLELLKSLGRRTYCARGAVYSRIWQRSFAGVRPQRAPPRSS
jgi:hypothetical protein